MKRFDYWGVPYEKRVYVHDELQWSLSLNLMQSCNDISEEFQMNTKHKKLLKLTRQCR